MQAVMRTAAWLALVTGLLEAAILTVRKVGFGSIIGLSQHYGWMAPVGYLLVLLPIALVLAALQRRLPRLFTFERVAGLIVFLCAIGVLFMFPRLHRLAMIALAAGIAYRMATAIRDRRPAFDGMVRRSLPWLGGSVAAIALLTSTMLWATERRALAALPSSPAAGPNVILIILDVVRAASMSLYGHPRPTTPHLESLAQRGVVFDRAFSPSPWTLPAHGSLFTGRYPHEQSSNWADPLDDRDPTLAEVLGEAGYMTGGFAANPFYTMWEHGLDRGFVHYEGYPVSIGQMLNSSSLAALLFAGRPGFTTNVFRRIIGNYEYFGRRKADDITNAFLAWQPSTDRPFFAFLNYNDAHDPYTPPAPYARRFDVNDPRTMWQRVTGRVAGMTEEQRQRLWYDPNAYDATIAFMDAELGRMFEELQRRGVMENTLVIVASDHGEHLGEHGRWGHGNTLYFPVLHVPLVLSYPARIPADGRRIRDAVTLRSLPATVLDVLGIPARMPGRSLATMWSADSPPGPGDPLLFEVRRGINVDPSVPIAAGDMHGLIEDELFLIRNGDRTEELYDLVRDPALAQDMAETPAATPILERMRGSLERLLGGGRAPASMARQP